MRLIRYFLIFVMSTTGLAAENDAAGPEVELVTRFHEKLLYIMQNAGDLGYEGRYEVLSSIIPGSFDLPLISQVILGRHWSSLSDAEKAQFISLYENLITSTYASRFDTYSGEDFVFKSIEDLNRGRKLVKTELKTNADEFVTLDYLIAKNDGEWKIISVVADGANDISIKRAEYADVIKLHGYSALLDEIRTKIQDMATPK